MKHGSVATLCIIFLIITAGSSNALVRVVSSTTDLSSIAKHIGGNKVIVSSIASGKANPHFVEVLPSYMVKVVKADIYLKVGMGLDLWADRIIDGSRNGRIMIIDCSRDILPLEKPDVRVDASMGDVHPQGNPHYWLDPDNGVIIAESIASALKRIDPQNASFYESNLRAFKEKIEAKIQDWAEKAKPLYGIEIITYHNSWPYFCRTFGIKVAGYVEPKPGIEPTPSHTAELIELIRARNIKVIGKEPYYSNRTPKNISRLTGAKVVDLPPSVGGLEDAEDYFSLFDALLDTLNKAIEE